MTNRQVKCKINNCLVLVLGLALLILVAALAYYFSTGIHDTLVKLLITLLVVTCVLMAALAINGKSRSWIAIQSKSR